jgi:hypothetical protein
MPGGNDRNETAPQAGGPFRSADRPMDGARKAVTASRPAARTKRERVVLPIFGKGPPYAAGSANNGRRSAVTTVKKYVLPGVRSRR